jgi:hypothetical protein
VWGAETRACVIRRPGGSAQAPPLPNPEFPSWAHTPCRRSAHPQRCETTAGSLRACKSMGTPFQARGKQEHGSDHRHCTKEVAGGDGGRGRRPTQRIEGRGGGCHRGRSPEPRGRWKPSLHTQTITHMEHKKVMRRPAGPAEAPEDHGRSRCGRAISGQRFTPTPPGATVPAAPLRPLRHAPTPRSAPQPHHPYNRSFKHRGHVRRRSSGRKTGAARDATARMVCIGSCVSPLGASVARAKGFGDRGETLTRPDCKL